MKEKRLYKFFIAFLLGISSGLPLLAIGSTLQAWMKDDGIDLSTIGAISIIGLPYSLKFLWAPVFDRFTLPFLGKRRGWIAVTQLAVALALFLISFCSPSVSLTAVLVAAFLVAFASASQDIVLDAHRRELFSDDELAMGSGVFVIGYRVGTLISGAAALGLAESLPWHQVYQILAAVMSVGFLACLIAPEPVSVAKSPKTMRDAVVQPLKEFFLRKGALEILAFILLYKLGDQLAGNLIVPYLQELGYQKIEIGRIQKFFGLVALIVGGIAGGSISLRIGINRALWIFGFLQAATIIGFVLLIDSDRSTTMLCAVIFAEYFSAGMGTTAYMAFMAAQCDRRFTATQYALLTSLMGVPRTVLAAPTGVIAQSVGWPGFFCICTLLAVPGLIMLMRVAPWNERRPMEAETPQVPV